MGLISLSCAEEDGGELSTDSTMLEVSELGLASVTASGSGCPRGTWKSEWLPDNKSVAIKFEAFEGALGRRSSSSRSCKVTIKLKGEDGTAYAPATVSVRGETSSTTRYATSVHWANDPDEMRKFENDRSGDVENVHLVGDLWSACSGERALVVDTQLTVNRLSAATTMDFVVLEQGVTFASRACADGLSAKPDASVDCVPDEPVEPTPDAGPKPMEPMPDAGEKPVEPPPLSEAGPTLSLSNISASGSGCPAGSAKVVPSADGQTFGIEFANFAAAITADTPRYSTKQCGVNLRVKAPVGYAVAIASLRARGESALSEPAAVRLQAEPSVVGTNLASSPPGINKTVSARGAFDVQESFGGDALVFGGCGAENTFQLSLRLAVDRSSMPQVGSAKLNALGPVSFTLRKCP